MIIPTMKVFWLIPLCIYCVSFVVIILSLITAYNILNITVILILFLLSVAIAFYAMLIRDKFRSLTLVLAVSHVVCHLLFGTLAFALVFLVFNSKLESDLESLVGGTIGLLVFASMMYLPIIPSLCCIKHRNQYHPSILNVILFFPIGFLLSLLSLLPLMLFTYLFLVLLFPGIYGLNT